MLFWTHTSNWRQFIISVLLYISMSIAPSWTLREWNQWYFLVLQTSQTQEHEVRVISCRLHQLLLHSPRSIPFVPLGYKKDTCSHGMDGRSVRGEVYKLDTSASWEFITVQWKPNTKSENTWKRSNRVKWQRANLLGSMNKWETQCSTNIWRFRYYWLTQIILINPIPLEN